MSELGSKGRDEQGITAPAVFLLAENVWSPESFQASLLRHSLQLAPLCWLSEQAQGNPVSHVCLDFSCSWPLCQALMDSWCPVSWAHPHPPSSSHHSLPTPGKCLLP